MSDKPESDFSPRTEQEFPSPVQIETLLQQLNIEYLDVDQHRLYVIFSKAVFEIRVLTGTLDTAETIRLAVVEGPDRPSDNAEGVLAEFSDLLHVTVTAEQ